MMDLKILPRWILVKIDKAKQTKHQEKIGNIYISQKYLYMKYNLQHGPIIQIGTKAAKRFPDMEVGDTAIFRHTIEDEGQNWRLLYKEYNPEFPNTYSMQDEFRVIDGSEDFEVLGWIKKDGTMMANDRYVFVSTEVKLMGQKLITDLFQVEDESWKDNKTLHDRLAKMEIDQTNIREKLKDIRDGYEFEDTHKYLARNAADMGRITNLINAKKLCRATVELVGTNISRQLGIKKGSTIVVDDYALMYMINVHGKNYMLVANEYVLGILN